MTELADHADECTDRYKQHLWKPNSKVYYDYDHNNSPVDAYT